MYTYHTTAAHGGDDCIEISHLLEGFQGDCGLASDDILHVVSSELERVNFSRPCRSEWYRIVVRMDENGTSLCHNSIGCAYEQITTMRATFSEDARDVEM